MDIRNVQTFIRVAELGSFTKAANELNYVQSTVTMQIQQLERELEFPLFDRIGKRVSLTAMGRDFLGYAYEITRVMQEVSNLGKDEKDMSGTLRVGVLESLLFSNMLKILPGFKDTYRNLNLQLKMGQASELLQQLKQNQLDMVYLSAGLNKDPDLHCYYKRREQLVFISSPDHPAAKQKKISVSELLSYDFVVTEHSGICYGRLQELAVQHNGSLRASVEVDSTIAITSLVQNNMAIAFLPKYSVQKQLQEKSLLAVDVDLEPQVYYSQILCHKRRWVSPFMEKLIAQIKMAYPERERIRRCHPVRW